MELKKGNKMKISSTLPLSNKQTFGRRLNKNEEKGYNEAIQEGLKVLDKELGMIVHNSTTPSKPIENTGIGSLLSDNARANFIPLLSKHGFSKIQQEPDNYRRSWNPSPYTKGNS